MRKSFPLAAFLVTGVLAVSGCGSSKSSSTVAPTSTIAAPTATSGAPLPALSCASVTAAVVNSALGISVGAPTGGANDGGSIICDYAVGSKFDAVKIQFTPNAIVKTLTDTKQNATDQGATNVMDVNGLGEAAFSSSLAGVNTVGVLKNQLMIVLSSTASVDKEKALITQLYATA